MATATARVRAEIGIEGMSCGHCVKAVTAALVTVPGLSIKAVEVGRAEVSAPGTPTVEKALEAIADAGFQARVKSLGAEAGPTGGGCGCCGCGPSNG